MRIHHVALRTRDVARLERFYAGTLALAVVRRDPRSGNVWLATGGAVVMIERAAEGEPDVQRGSMDLVAFATDDLGAWRDRLRTSDVAIEAETPHTLYFRDPDGRRVAVSTFPLATNG